MAQVMYGPNDIWADNVSNRWLKLPKRFRITIDFQELPDEKHKPIVRGKRRKTRKTRRRR